MTESQLDFYWQLASDVDTERQKAVMDLLESLRKSNKDEDWEYALERLIRGLSSSRKSSRFGFAHALNVILFERRRQIKFGHCLDLIDKHFRNFGNVPGHEERGFYLGELFALEALNKSHMFSLSATPEDMMRFFDASIQLATKKSWLQEPCFFAIQHRIILYAHRNYASAPYDPKKFYVDIIKKITAKGFAYSMEGIACYLAVPAEYRALVGKSVPDGWPLGDPLAQTNLPTLSKIVRNAPVEAESTNAKQLRSLSASGRIHFVWRFIVKDILPFPEDDPVAIKRQNALFAHRPPFDLFWNMVVDEFFTSTTERKECGFQIFEMFFKESISMNPEIFPSIFSQNFLRCLTNQSAGDNRLLHKKATAVLANILKQAEEEPEVSYRLLLTFLEYSVHFDRLSRTSTVQKLWSLLPDASVLAITYDLLDTVRYGGFGHSTDPSDSQRIFALDALLSLVKSHKDSAHPACQDSIEAIVVFLAEKSFFQDLLNPNIVEACRSRLNSILAILLNKKHEWYSSWAVFCVHRIIDMEEEQPELLIDSFEPGDELTKKKDKAIKTLMKISKRSGAKHAKTPELQAFELLFALVIIQIYSGDSEASGMVDELQLCYNKIIGKSNIEEGGQDNENVNASTVLTEILISFLSRKSTLLRNLSEEVWSTFTGETSSESLTLLYDILGARESKDGQDSLFDNDEEENQSSDEDLGMDIEDEEQEMEEEIEEQVSDDSEDDDDDDDEEEEDSDEKSNDETYKTAVHEADEKAGLALSAALGINGAENGGSNTDEDDSDDDDMDDEQMMALDATLSNIFKERQEALKIARKGTKRKLDARDARENVIHLKSRVLDLLTKYVQNEPSNWNIVSCIIPLLSLIKNTRTLSLGEKAHNLLKTKVCRTNTLPKPNDNHGLSETIALLSEIHTEQMKVSTNKAHQLACSQTSIFLIKIAMSIDKDKAPEMISAVYGETLVDWIKTPQSKITSTLFIDVINYFASIKKNEGKKGEKGEKGEKENGQKEKAQVSQAEKGKEERQRKRKRGQSDSEK